MLPAAKKGEWEIFLIELGAPQRISAGARVQGHMFQWAPPDRATPTMRRAHIQRYTIGLQFFQHVLAGHYASVCVWRGVCLGGGVWALA